MAKGNLPVSAFLSQPGTVDLSRLAQQKREQPPEAVEVYGDELPKIQAVGEKINAMFARKRINNDEWPDLIERIITMYDEIGWEVGVEILDASRKVPDGEGNLVDVPVVDQDGYVMRVPSIAFLGRSNRKEYETDHDRIQHNVRNGLYDGVKGVIDPNTGQLKEEPKRKLIY